MGTDRMFHRSAARSGPAPALSLHAHTARWIGSAAIEACGSSELAPGGSARVVGVFSAGFYVLAREHLFAVGRTRIFPGPLHLVLEEIDQFPAEGDAVCVVNGGLSAGAVAVDLRSATPWEPTLPPAGIRGGALRALVELQAMVPVPADVAGRWQALRRALQEDDFGAARAMLEGLGGGLTPTGDDVLAGLLLVDHWCHPESSRPMAVAQAAATTDLSRAFLRWAALGQSIEPVHVMLDAAAAWAGAGQQHSLDAFQEAAGRVAGIGGSSGQALLVGIGLAAECATSGLHG